MTQLQKVVFDELSDPSQLDQLVSLFTGNNVFDAANGYGADPTGSQDSTIAIQSALNAALAAGGGTVYLPSGTYLVSMGTRSVTAGTVWAALIMGSNTLLKGAGQGATTIKLASNQTGRNGQGGVVSIITNMAVLNAQGTGTDSHIYFEDFTLDGNSANQTDTHNGFEIMGQYVGWKRVRGQDVRGTTIDGTNNETYIFYPLSGSDIWFEDCQALQVNGPVSNGFFIGFGCTNAWLHNCRAYGIIGAGGSAGFGFNGGTGGISITWIGCIAEACGVGFHLEDTWGVGTTGPFRYIGCTAGSTAAKNSPGHYPTFPYSNSQSLGNVVNGFEIGTTSLNDVFYIGCVSRNNGSAGLYVGGATGFLFVMGGDYSANGTYGLNISNTGGFTGMRVSDYPSIAFNGVAAFRIGTTNYSAYPGNVTAPAVPNSTTASGNPFPMNADVYITAGSSTCQVTIQSTSAFTIPANGIALLRLMPGQAFTLTYTNAPTWTWFVE